MAVSPGLVLFDGDHGGLAEFALHDLDFGILAVGALACSAVVGALFYGGVNAAPQVGEQEYIPTR